MEGAAQAAATRYDDLIALAWHTAAFSGAIQAGKLKKLAHYQRKSKAPARTAAAAVEIMREFQARGAKMTIRRVEGEGEL